MPQCEYVGPSGNQCPESVAEADTYCFWHDRDADKNGPEVKQQLEDKVKNQISLEGYELSHANLEDAWLIEADLSYANLSRANLKDGHLFGINLNGAQLFRTNLEHANLKEANLEDADLLGATLDDTDLERSSWGDNHVLRNHKEALTLQKHGDAEGAFAKYQESEDIYRKIRRRYEAVGLNDIAGHFFYGEMYSRRMQMPRFSSARFFSRLFDLLCGYGEVPSRIIASSLLYILFSALIYCFLGIQNGDQVYAFHPNASLMEDIKIFGYALYFSVVTFTTLGYGDISPIGFSRPFAALEAFNGIILNTLFMLTLIRKMTR
ncbi:MAG: pentapeptide repeat-containing protein [bacterium]|nr:pentapeptide repeat-containing protein [bacterium]